MHLVTMDNAYDRLESTLVGRNCEMAGKTTTRAPSGHCAEDGNIPHRETDAELKSRPYGIKIENVRSVTELGEGTPSDPGPAGDGIRAPCDDGEFNIKSEEHTSRMKKQTHAENGIHESGFIFRGTGGCGDEDGISATTKSIGQGRLFKICEFNARSHAIRNGEFTPGIDQVKSDPKRPNDDDGDDDSSGGDEVTESVSSAVILEGSSAHGNERTSPTIKSQETTPDVSKPSKDSSGHTDQSADTKTASSETNAASANLNKNVDGVSGDKSSSNLNGSDATLHTKSEALPANATTQVNGSKCEPNNDKCNHHTLASQPKFSPSPAKSVPQNPTPTVPVRQPPTANKAPLPQSFYLSPVRPNISQKNLILTSANGGIPTQVYHILQGHPANLKPGLASYAVPLPGNVYSQLSPNQKGNAQCFTGRLGPLVTSKVLDHQNQPRTSQNYIVLQKIPNLMTVTATKQTNDEPVTSQTKRPVPPATPQNSSDRMLPALAPIVHKFPASQPMRQIKTETNQTSSKTANIVTALQKTTEKISTPRENERFINGSDGVDRGMQKTIFANCVPNSPQKGIGVKNESRGNLQNLQLLSDKSSPGRQVNGSDTPGSSTKSAGPGNEDDDSETDEASEGEWVDDDDWIGDSFDDGGEAEIDADLRSLTWLASLRIPKNLPKLDSNCDITGQTVLSNAASQASSEPTGDGECAKSSTTDESCADKPAGNTSEKESPRNEPTSTSADDKTTTPETETKSDTKKSTGTRVTFSLPKFRFHSDVKNSRARKSKSALNAIGTRPSRSFSSLIYEALKEEGPMNVSEIYKYLQRSYPYFKTKDSGNWKNSIRHNLSLNGGFTKGGKGHGKGHLWRIDPDAEPAFLKEYVKPPKKSFNKKTSEGSTKESAGPGPGRRRTMSFTREQLSDISARLAEQYRVDDLIYKESLINDVHCNTWSIDEILEELEIEPLQDFDSIDPTKSIRTVSPLTPATCLQTYNDLVHLVDEMSQSERPTSTHTWYSISLPQDIFTTVDVHTP